MIKAAKPAKENAELKNTLKRLSATALLAIIVSAPVSAETIYSDGFENGLSGWAKNGEDATSSIEIISEGCPGGKKCIRISKSKRQGFTFIGQAFRVPSNGTLRVSAKIRAPSLVKGEKDYQQGKFQAVIIKDGKEIDFPHSDISAPVSEWIPRTFEALDLDPSNEVVLRIGLQNAKGVLEVDDFSVTFAPD